MYWHDRDQQCAIEIDRGDWCGEVTVKVWLEPVEVAKRRGFHAHEIGGILTIVAEHQAAFLEA